MSADDLANETEQRINAVPIPYVPFDKWLQSSRSNPPLAARKSVDLCNISSMQFAGSNQEFRGNITQAYFYRGVLAKLMKSSNTEPGETYSCQRPGYPEKVYNSDMHRIFQ